MLVIDDDEAIREMLRLSLELEGYEVDTAANGREGIDVLRKRPLPGLILLDLMMPVMNGWQVLKELEASPFAVVPVIVITAYEYKAESVGDRPVLRKPINLDDLLKAVSEHCCRDRRPRLC